MKVQRHKKRQLPTNKGRVTAKTLQIHFVIPWKTYITEQSLRRPSCNVFSFPYRYPHSPPSRGWFDCNAHNAFPEKKLNSTEKNFDSVIEKKNIPEIILTLMSWNSSQSAFGSSLSLKAELAFLGGHLSVSFGWSTQVAGSTPSVSLSTNHATLQYMLC